MWEPGVFKYITLGDTQQDALRASSMRLLALHMYAGKECGDANAATGQRITTTTSRFLSCHWPLAKSGVLGRIHRDG